MQPFAPLPHSFRQRAAASLGSVFLETSRPSDEQNRSLLFTSPTAVITAFTIQDVAPALYQAEQAAANGAHVAGYIAYEAGFAFEPRLQALITPSNQPLLWLGIYDAPEVFHHEMEGSTAYSHLPHPPALPLAFNISFETYQAQLQSIRHLIEQGDTYQANLTLEARWQESADSADLLARFMQAQPVEFGALIHTDGAHIVSASPELFFRRTGDRITTRPMKGTAPRGRWSQEDDAHAEWLQNDPKNRAET